MTGLRAQCWLFAVGSSLFAIGTAPGFSASAGAGATNTLCFLGSWCFTSAAFLQWRLSGEPLRADWMAAAVQFCGTLLFNVSTGAAVWAHTVSAERDLVWSPDAAGSVAFLVSSAVAVLALGSWWAPRRRDWRATWLNMVGSIAFGVSAVAAYVRPDGITADALLANSGTFVGALCFLAAALLTLPRVQNRPVERRVLSRPRR
ncbi:hypothetical protein [Mycolicibacterium thermoresistibile]